MGNSAIDPQYINTFVVHSQHNGNMYLLLHRCGTYLHGTWQMVTGHVHEGEKAYDAAIREVREETGLTPNRLYNADAVETFYMKRNDKILFVPVFVAFIDQPDVEIYLSPQEHDDYEWAAYDVALDRLLFAEQKRVLTHVHKNFILNDPNPIHLIQ
ncbi:MAG TPA: NUDIX domain-containing protein [Rhabdochlamydiaceae bacterium]|jgi:dATP pyrophosphohydrolase